MQYHQTTLSFSRLFTFAKQQARALLLVGAGIISGTQAYGQGCVVAHGSGLPASVVDQGDSSEPWDVSVSYRWFTSDRHFVGITEQKQREVAGDQVINHSHFTDLDLNYTVSPRFSTTITVPYVSHTRSQVVKNSNNVILDRFATQASGLADISVVGNAWVFDPTPATQGNIQLNLGLSLPTGKDDVTDTFEQYDKASNKIIAVQKHVDQSIQPGSGGYGIIVGFYGYRELGAGFNAYASGDYVITPQRDDGVSTAPGAGPISIPDTYLGRIGTEYSIPQVTGVAASLGLRVEGVAVYDLIGGSTGFRRPGYSLDVEPGIVINRSRWSARLYVPVAFQRDRLQSVPDKQKTRATGVYTQGDAAFADYEVITSFNYKF